MPNTKGKAVETTPANATNNSFVERMKMAVHVSNATIVGTFRNSEVIANAKLDDFEKVNSGIANTSVRKGEVFRVLKPMLIKQKIGNNTPTLPVLIIENLAGEQRAIYASGLMRSTPTRSTEINQYSDEVLTFERGLLKDVNGFTKVFEKLVGDGEQYVHVTDSVQYTTAGARIDQETGQPSTKPEDQYSSNLTSFALELVSKEEAMAIGE